MNVNRLFDLAIINALSVILKVQKLTEIDAVLSIFKLDFLLGGVRQIIDNSLINHTH